MHGLYCDSCGEPLLVEGNVRYVAKIEVYAAYDPLEITEQDFEEATEENMAHLIDQMRESSEKELQDQVYQSFHFDLCPRCRSLYVRDPLAPARAVEGKDPEAAGGSET